MYSLFVLGTSLAIGQGTPPAPPPMELPRYVVPAVPAAPAPPLSTAPAAPSAAPGAGKADAGDAAKPTTGENPKDKPADEKDKPAEDKPAAAPDTYFIMDVLKGTPLGERMAKNRVSISGWSESSYTASTTATTNLPVTWNDRANRFLQQQTWFRFDRALDTDSKCVSYGWHLDTLFGTDYRFTMNRGFWNEQLNNSRPDPREPTGLTQNLYGFDLPQYYVNAYLPNLFKGTEVRFGRMYTLFGYESVEAVSTPLLSRSYAFNWAPPFFNSGLYVGPTFNKNWSGKYMLANGNDVTLGSRSEELRFVGATTWTDDDKKNSLTLATSLGRGKFNTSMPFGPATTGLMYEPAGRNNINVFDLVYTHQITDPLSYAIEMIYGYQTGVPANVNGGIVDPDRPVGTSGTAHWFAAAQYLTYKFSDKWSGIVRAEIFNDAEGQRTGFVGTYTAVTAGLQWHPSKSVTLRPEIRYDYNGHSRPFSGSHDILTAATDLLIRY